MNHLSGLSREQKLLLPEAVEDYVAQENPVRFIDAFVSSLNLRQLGFGKALPAATGRPPYDPGDLLRLYLYGYLHRIRSWRLLEKECTRHLEVLWLLRTLKPDFKTIADFRRDNRKPLAAACREFTWLCRKLDLFGGELLAIDGSKFKAVNARDKNFNDKKLRELIANIDAKIGKYLEELDQGDQGQAAPAALAREELEKKIAALKERKEDYQALEADLGDDHQISTTDPDSRLMHTRQGAEMAYNVQTAVDAKHKLIVEHEVVNDVTDLNQLANLATAARETLGVEKRQVVADMGYYNHADVQRCVDNGITPYLAKADTSANTKLGLFGKNRFRFDPERDVYLCPGNQELNYRFSNQEKGRELRYYRARGCKACALRSQCTRNKANRTITREANEAVMEEMAERVKANPQMMRLRKAIVEHPFGTIKRAMNAGYFLCRGLGAVRAEMSLTVLAYNLKRVLNLVSFAALMQAVG